MVPKKLINTAHIERGDAVLITKLLGDHSAVIQDGQQFKGTLAYNLVEKGEIVAFDYTESGKRLRSSKIDKIHKSEKCYVIKTGYSLYHIVKMYDHPPVLIKKGDIILLTKITGLKNDVVVDGEQFRGPLVDDVTSRIVIKEITSGPILGILQSYGCYIVKTHNSMYLMEKLS